MALVQQEPLLFGLSVEENVGYSLSAARAREGGGRVDFNDAAVRARVEEACRRANAHEFVGGLSDGWGGTRTASGHLLEPSLSLPRTFR